MAEEYQALKLNKGADVSKLLDDRHITEDEIKMTISDAERSGQKLCRKDNDHLLASKKIEKVTFTVEYSPSGDKTYTVHTAYAHRVQVEG
jgi:hypothetical protein